MSGANIARRHQQLIDSHHWVDQRLTKESNEADSDLRYLGMSRFEKETGGLKPLTSTERTDNGFFDRNNEINVSHATHHCVACSRHSPDESRGVRFHTATYLKKTTDRQMVFQEAMLVFSTTTTAMHCLVWVSKLQPKKASMGGLGNHSKTTTNFMCSSPSSTSALQRRSMTTGNEVISCPLSHQQHRRQAISPCPERPRSQIECFHEWISGRTKQKWHHGDSISETMSPSLEARAHLDVSERSCAPNQQTHR
jgi:hypothetical protein